MDEKKGQSKAEGDVVELMVFKRETRNSKRRY